MWRNESINKYLDVIDRKDANHGIVFAFVPIFIDLSSYEDDVTLLKRELSATVTFAFQFSN